MPPKKKNTGGFKNLNINTPALILNALGYVCFLMVLFMPNLLANASGLNYYPHPRSWGLWHVTGRISQTHTEQWQTQCKIAASMSFDVVCVSPLCKWYDSKCSANRMVAYVSYALGGFVIMSMILTVASIIFSLRKQRKYTKWTTISSVLALGLLVVGLMVYFYCMSTAFDIINSYGYYPVPQPSAGMFTYCVGLFFWFCGFVAHFCRGRAIVKEANFEEDTFYEVQVMKKQYGL